MSIKHYFSKDENQRARFIFNLIAPYYHWIDKGTQKGYKQMAALLNEKSPLDGKSVLDMGCGTGAWLKALSFYPVEKVMGLDMSSEMLKQAEIQNPELDCVHQEGGLTKFEDDSFDMVTATFVLHGMKAGKRAQLLKEMKRIAKEKVVVHDFYGKTQAVAVVLEWLERSDFRNFKKHFPEEMAGVFPSSFVIPGVGGKALYVGEVK